MFDGLTNRAELAALVALVHSLVVYFDECLERGEDLPTLHRGTSRRTNGGPPGTGSTRGDPRSGLQ